MIKKINATAIISVILIVALVSITAITMQGYLRSEVNRTQLVIENDELYNNLLSIESWGISTLKQLEKQPDISKEQTKFTKNVNKAILNGKIINQNGLFNLNYLNNINFCRQQKADKNQIAVNNIFSNLLVLVNKNNATPLTIEQANSIIEDIQTSMCSRSIKKNNSSNNNLTNPDSSDDSDKNKNKVKWQYQPARQSFTDISELKLINNITSEIYNNLKDVITAVPTMPNGKDINFNLDYLSPELFAAMANVDVPAASQFLDNIKNASGTQKNNSAIEFISVHNKSKIDDLQTIKNFLTSDIEQNNYYIIYGTVTKSEYTMSMQSLVALAQDAKIIWRKRG